MNEVPRIATRPGLILADEEHTWMGHDRAIVTPPDVAADGLGGFLDRVARFTRYPAAVVLLDGELPALLGMPGSEPPETPGDAYPSAQRRGWTIRYDEDRDAGTKTERRWATAVYRGGGRSDGRTAPDGPLARGERVIHLGVIPWMNATDFPWPRESRAQTMWFLDRFEALLGQPYAGPLGSLSGMSKLRDDTVTPRTREDNRPQWVWANAHLCPAAKAVNTEATDRWRGNPNMRPWKPWRHEYDLSLQYLGAEQAVRLAPSVLHPLGALDSDHLTNANPAGYYKIVIPHMRDLNGLIPHPAGSRKGTPGEERWVTHATLDLLVDCADQHNLMDRPIVTDRWVSLRKSGEIHQGTRIMRRWGDSLLAAIGQAHALKTAKPDTAVLFDTLKGVYRRTRGMLQAPGRRVYRPDWGHAVVGLARANMWRAMYAEGMKTGRWPIYVDADQAWYTSTEEDAEADGAWPDTFTRGDGTRPGTWRYKGHTEREPE